MFELHYAFSSLVVLSVDGSLVDGFPLDGDVSVGPVLSQHRDLNLSARLLDQVTALLE